MSRAGKVTVVGAGFYGSTTALRLAEYDIFDTVVLTDIIEGKPEGLALDINQSRSIEDTAQSIAQLDHARISRARLEGEPRSPAQQRRGYHRIYGHAPAAGDAPGGQRPAFAMAVYA